ncbi:hypothetical protein J6590_106859, partial [Homalodisca vitripennis]
MGCLILEVTISVLNMIWTKTRADEGLGTKVAPAEIEDKLCFTSGKWCNDAMLRVDATKDAHRKETLLRGYDGCPFICYLVTSACVIAFSPPTLPASVLTSVRPPPERWETLPNGAVLTLCEV